MKIKLSHSAQIVGARNKVDQHAPGAEVETDDEQANRLIANGYAKEVRDELETAPFVPLLTPGA